MNKDKQRIAIATALGWKNCSEDNPMGEPKTGPVGVPPDNKMAEIWLNMQSLPDYLADLNAMAEAIKSLTPTQRDTVRDHLKEICLTDWMAANHFDPFPDFATAEQRAKAFLLTLGKWTDEA